MDKDFILEKMNASTKNTLMSTLGITYTDVGEGFLEAKMPVNQTVHQPMGLLHGGATAALAETLGSAASHLIINRETESIVGIEINANHLKGVKSGTVTGRATIQHQGKKLHVWNIDVVDEEQRKIAVCRLTCMIIPKK